MSPPPAHQADIVASDPLTASIAPPITLHGGRSHTEPSWRTAEVSTPERLMPSRMKADEGAGLRKDSIQPRSRYYVGPPPPGSAFGTRPQGVVGRDMPQEIIRIERDYSLSPSHIPQFYSSFPLELESRLSPVHFSEIINDINLLMIQANDTKWALLDNALAVITFWLSPWVLGSHYARRMKDLERLLYVLNTTRLNPLGLNLLHPASKAWLFLEMEYY